MNISTIQDRVDTVKHFIATGELYTTHHYDVQNCVACSLKCTSY